MKVGFFSNGNVNFVGAVFSEKVFNMSLAAIQTGAPSLNDITSIFAEERFDGRIFHGLYEETKGQQDLWHSLDNLLFLPLLMPRKIICLGLNYTEHAKEGNVPVPEEPIYFQKATTSVIAHNQPVIYPLGLGRIDHEVELAAVIGKRAKNVKSSFASDYIAGYTILNDVTARELQKKDLDNRHPWFRSKSMDTFCPIGPRLVTADEITPTEPLAIQLRVNGEIRQSSSTSNLVFNIPALLEAISKLITLEAGDILATGTPAGISPIYPGDVMEAEIEKVGVLRNPVRKNS